MKRGGNKKHRQDRFQRSGCSAPHIAEALRQQRLNNSPTSSSVVAQTEQQHHQRIPGFYYDKTQNRYFKMTKEMKAKAKAKSHFTNQSNSSIIHQREQLDSVVISSQSNNNWTTHLHNRSIFSFPSRSAEAVRYSINRFSEAVLSRPNPYFRLISKSQSRSNDMVGVVTDVAFHSYFGVASITSSGYVSFSQCLPEIEEMSHRTSETMQQPQITMAPTFVGVSIEEVVKFAVWLPITADPTKHILAIAVSGNLTDSIKLLKFAKLSHHSSNTQSNNHHHRSVPNEVCTSVTLTYQRSVLIK